MRLRFLSKGVIPLFIFRKMAKLMIGKCLNPVLCKEKHKRWVTNQSNFKNKNQRAFDKLVGRIEREGIENSLDYSRHALMRMKERFISKEEIESVLDMAWVIEGRANGELLVLVFYRGANNRMMPLHLSIMPDGGYYLIKTAYNPHKDIWGENYDNKTCFCGKRRFGEEL